MKKVFFLSTVVLAIFFAGCDKNNNCFGCAPQPDPNCQGCGPNTGGNPQPGGPTNGQPSSTDGLGQGSRNGQGFTVYVPFQNGAMTELRETTLYPYITCFNQTVYVEGYHHASINSAVWNYGVNISIVQGVYYDAFGTGWYYPMIGATGAQFFGQCGGIFKEGTGAINDESIYHIAKTDSIITDFVIRESDSTNTTTAVTFAKK